MQIQLKMAHEAEMAWRSSDLDGNGLRDFWTRDWAGLGLVPDAAGKPVDLIERCIAVMDHSGATHYPDIRGAVSYKGYWVGAMTADEHGRPLQTDADGDGKAWTHPTAFAFCAWPEAHGATYNSACNQHVSHVDVVRFHYIVNQEGVIYRKDLGHNSPVLRWPASAPTIDGWEVVEGLR